MEYRTLGKTKMRVSAVALGCWPIAGMTSPGATDENSIATIRACLDLGINHLDTAYMYGAQGQSERLIRKALGPRRDEMVIATKGGLHWNEQGERVPGGRPDTLRRECEESLLRLGTDRVELYYLHAPDPGVPVAESAGELQRLVDEGKVLSVGASNLDVPQLEAFHAECPLTAFQPLYNILQREIEADTLPWCVERGISVLVYWPLLKGLLAGGLRRDSVLDETDSRLKYPMFHGKEWEKNHDLIDRLRQIAAEAGRTVAQLVINWTIHRPGITAALCGAKRPDQIRDTAGAADWRLSEDQLAQIDQALAERGPPAAETPI
ncbi:MAG: aldo/keto reductase [Pirellulales bacterium]|nr:aldo/keto reductase [Pirellulales bacterium]